MSTPKNINDVLYIKELGYSFSTTGEEADPIPIVLDATTQYSKSYQAQVTDSPVGDKTDRSDHYRVKPPKLSFTGIISNLDIGIYSQWAMNSESNQQVNTQYREAGGYSASFTSPETGFQRGQQYVERLERILRDKILIEVRVPRGLTTTNCLITNLDISTSRTIGDAFKIKVSVKQVDILQGHIVNKPAPDVSSVVTDSVDKGVITSYDASVSNEQGVLNLENLNTTLNSGVNISLDNSTSNQGLERFTN